MTRPIVIYAPRARREFDAALIWWGARGSARPLADALVAALDRIEQFPRIGARVRQDGRWLRTRKYIVDPVGYHLFYDYEPSAHLIRVRCLWHEKRRPPRL